MKEVGLQVVKIGKRMWEGKIEVVFFYEED